MSRRARWLLISTTVVLACVLGVHWIDDLRSWAAASTLPVSDEQVVGYLASPPIERAKVGLQPVPTTGQVRVNKEYSLLLFHVVQLDFERPDFVKTIFVESTADGYKWYEEADTHWGPLSYEGSSGVEREAVYIGYSLKEGFGASYSGPREEYLTQDPDGLALSQVLPLLEEWGVDLESR
jgi:hypothetical protein